MNDEERRERQRGYTKTYRERLGKDELNARQRARYDPAREKRYRDARGRTREDIRRYELKFRHAMTPEDWETLWTGQDGNCWLCQRPMTRPNPGRGTARGTDATVDHDHSCCPGGRSCPACRRGLAHRTCNSLIGQLGEDPALLRFIADRIEARREVMPHA